MTIQIVCPNRRQTERDYVFSVIFSHWLKLSWVRVSEERSDYCVRIPGQPGEIRLPDSFFLQNEDLWLTDAMLPMHSLNSWDSKGINIGNKFEVSRMPVLFGAAIAPGSTDTNSVSIPIDIFGATFFMLSSYDELVSGRRDKHDRFLGKDSVAHKHRFLDRPIIDQYVEVLWLVMKELWPALERKQRIGRVVVTCDVDVPFDPRANNAIALLKGVLVHTLRGQGLQSGLELFRNYGARNSENYQHDPCYTFDWYMSKCEKANRAATFFFISDNTAGSLDGDYNIHDPKILSLLRSIVQRGHNIGVHGSYNSYQSVFQIKLEREKLNSALVEAGINYEVEGNRQHYLRWDSSKTPEYLDEAGYAYDTTGSYADLPGFRYGTAKPFPMWSWKNGRTLNLVQRPLICMECSVMAKRYMGLGHSEEAYSTMHKLKARALAFGGDFTLLWHNNQFNSGKDKLLFSSLLP